MICKNIKKILNLVFFAFFIASCVKSVEPLWINNLPRLPEKVRIVVSGDFMQHMPQIDAARNGDGFTYDTQLKYIAPLWQSADFVILNLETTLSFDNHYSGYPLFCAPAEIAFALARAGVSHTVLANNHSLDKGAKGVRETLAALDSAKIYHAGLYADSVSAEHILMLDKKGFKIALLNYTYSTNGNEIPRGMVTYGIDTALIFKHLVQAKKLAATHIVVFFHFGQEYCVTASPAQQRLALWARKHGADVVVGSHPHVPQQIDMQNKIVYSLGNFVSNQRQRFANAGLSVVLTFYEGFSEPKIQFVPHFVDISSSNPLERYRVLMPENGAVIDSEWGRAQFRSAIDDVRKIVRSDIEYE